MLQGITRKRARLLASLVTRRWLGVRAAPESVGPFGLSGVADLRGAPGWTAKGMPFAGNRATSSCLGWVRFAIFEGFEAPDSSVRRFPVAIRLKPGRFVGHFGLSGQTNVGQACGRGDLLSGSNGFGVLRRDCLR